MKPIHIIFLAVVGLLSLQAQAATFNFADYANGTNSNGASFSNSLDDDGLGENGYEWYSVTHDGVTVTATGSANNDDDANQYAYLDSSWHGDLAGWEYVKIYLV